MHELLPDARCACVASHSKRSGAGALSLQRPWLCHMLVMLRHPQILGVPAAVFSFRDLVSYRELHGTGSHFPGDDPLLMTDGGRGAKAQSFCPNLRQL